MKKISADEYYSEYYDSIVCSGAVGAVARSTQKSLEIGIKSNENFPKVLEVGAGSGQHLDYVKHPYTQYVESDIRVDLLPNRNENPRVSKVSIDANDLNIYAEGYFDRVIATCVLIHLSDPEKALREWRRVVYKKESETSGLITIYIPCEPGLLLRMGRLFSTVKRAKKLGINHLSFHYREHKYHFPYLKMLIQEVFADDIIIWKSFPVRGLSWNLSLWKVAQIRVVGGRNL